MGHVLVVDDEQSICWGLSQLIGKLGHSVDTAASAEQGFDLARRRAPDAIVLDVRLPGLDGIRAMARFREDLGQVPIIIITAYGDLAVAVQAVRQGAFDYLVKPFELDVAQHAIERALEARPPAASPVETLAAGESEPHIVGGSPGMQEVFKRIAVVAPSDACVHLHGESGTGKELVARAIHRYSRRADGPFVAVNIASLSPTLAESELFGHVRGAFTGAEQSRRGVLEQADGGTIFFDEVADIPLSIQVKLLRVLEHGELVPVGSDQPVKVDFRVITATHQSLYNRVVQGAFRHDLYFRLVTFEIELPSLRDRAQDIRDLAEYFLGMLSAKNGTPRPAISEEFLAELTRRPWYGNVRELRNAMEHAVILARSGGLLPEHLPLPTPAPTGRVTPLDPATALAGLIEQWIARQFDAGEEPTELYERFLRLAEPPLLKAVLQRHHGQCASAARQLGLHRTTLRKKLETFGITGTEPGS
jgi:two-component system nitrogen regulation response regulator GlnG